jgi:hypothetical protein
VLIHGMLDPDPLDRVEAVVGEASWRQVKICSRRWFLNLWRIFEIYECAARLFVGVSVVLG